MLFFFFVLFSNHTILSAQQSAKPVTDFKAAEDEIPYRIKKKAWTEIESERTLNSASFRKPDGAYVKYVSREPVNYYKEGKLVPINTELKFTNGGWIADEQQHPFCINANGNISMFVPELNYIYSFSTTVSINQQKAEIPDNIYVHGDTAMFSNIVPGVDKFVHFRNNGAKYSYIINNAASLPAGELVIRESLGLPEGCTITGVKDFSETITENNEERIKGHIEIKDKEGNFLMRFGSILVYDADGKTTVGYYYPYRMPDAGWQLKLIVDETWLHSTERVFPITVDPLVTGPTSNWTGGFMPSCFSPAYNVDSILVTIPGQITVTNLSVTSSYYADPFFGAWMSDGAMYFSTTCNNSITFTVASPGGDIAGTAYLQNYNLKSPLLCCIPQSCSQQQFWLRMHLARTFGGSGCNTTYLYYDPGSLWPFSAYIEGYTIETYSAMVNIFPNSFCANDCDVPVNIYARYGVPPFTFDHPWAVAQSVAGVPAGCSNVNEIEQLTLINPNCPNYCDTSTTVPLPPPIVTDACGNTVSGWPSINLNIKPVAQVTAVPDSLVICSDEDANITLVPCITTNATVYWYGNGLNGTGNMTDTTLSNTSGSYTTTYYNAYAITNGCYSDTISFAVTTEPEPVADFTNSSPVFATQPVTFTDNSNSPGTLSNWFWSFGDGNTDPTQNPVYIYTIPGDYTVCHAVTSAEGCTDTICKTITVVPLQIVTPNVISPNGDGVNDVLEFQYLEFYPSNHLAIFNRWGNLIYQKENYANDWNARDYPDGV
ncbi:MAG: gliding motility-associated C-terminal domain-containing protein, partial [Bacteroidota bacterium]